MLSKRKLYFTDSLTSVIFFLESVRDSNTRKPNGFLTSFLTKTRIKNNHNSEVRLVRLIQEAV